MKELLNVRMVENDAGEIDLMVDPDDFTGEHLDLLVRAIARVRSQIQPPVPSELPTQLSEIEVIPGPGWFVGGTLGGPILSVRHPAFGWLAFQLTDQMRADLMQALESAPSALPPSTAH